MIRRAIRWLDRLDWVDVFMYTFGSGVLTFFGGLVITGIHEGFHGNIEGRFLLVAWARVFVVALIGWLFFTKVWPRLAEWARRESNGHRQSSAGGGGPAGTGVDPQLTAISAAYLSGALASAGETGASPRVVEQEIIGERAWQLSPSLEGGCILFSASRCVSWEGPTLRADKLPEEGNSHGIYATRKLAGSGYDRFSVIGTVALSGRVVEGEWGYRAEQATIRSLRLRYLPSTYPEYSHSAVWAPSGVEALWDARPWEIADQLAARYQCECIIDWLPSSTLPAKELAR